MEYINRKGTASYKWDELPTIFGEDDLLPLWIADMDFKAPACITDALHKYLDAPMGYYSTPDSYYEAFIRWEKKYQNYDVKKEWILYAPGIVPAIYWGVQCFTKPGDGVIVQTPVYYPFMNAVNDNPGRLLVKSELQRVGKTYKVDYERFENDIANNNVKLFILCNPHNPIGRVWTEDELRSMLEICKKHNVLVISDEIHQDFVHPALGRGKVTAAAVGDFDDIVITMTSASKTFNLAATQNSFIIVPDKALREQFAAFQETIHVIKGNGFGYVAVEAAYNGGRVWLEELLQVVFGNYEYIRERFEHECQTVQIFTLEGTYLLWMDFGAHFNSTKTLQDFIQGKCRLAVDYGEWFGGESFSPFIRLNLATSRDTIELACDRMIAGLKNL